MHNLSNLVKLSIYIEKCRSKRVVGKFKHMVVSLSDLKLHLLVVIDKKCFLVTGDYRAVVTEKYICFSCEPIKIRLLRISDYYGKWFLSSIQLLFKMEFVGNLTLLKNTAVAVSLTESSYSNKKGHCSNADVS